jgi:hypothetical protein
MRSVQTAEDLGSGQSQHPRMDPRSRYNDLNRHGLKFGILLAFWTSRIHCVVLVFGLPREDVKQKLELVNVEFSKGWHHIIENTKKRVEREGSQAAYYSSYNFSPKR